jgi:hypothetical protein
MGYWDNWYETSALGEEIEDRRLRKLAQSKINASLEAIERERSTGDFWEKMARGAGSLVGFMVGGSAGAAVGNLGAGALYDKFDDRQERNFTSRDNVKVEGQNDIYTDYNALKSAQKYFNKANKEADTRHLTSPIKTYLTSLALSELGTSDQNWNEMSFWDKSTRSGSDIVSDAGGWGEMLGLTKSAEATEASKKMLEKVSGSTDPYQIASNDIPEIAAQLKVGNFDPRTGRKIAALNPSDGTPIYTDEKSVLSLLPPKKFADKEKDVAAEVLAQQRIEADKLATEEALNLLDARRNDIKFLRDNFHGDKTTPYRVMKDNRDKGLKPFLPKRDPVSNLPEYYRTGEGARFVDKFGNIDMAAAREDRLLKDGLYLFHDKGINLEKFDLDQKEALVEQLKKMKSRGGDDEDYKLFIDIVKKADSDGEIAATVRKDLFQKSHHPSKMIELHKRQAYSPGSLDKDWKKIKAFDPKHIPTIDPVVARSQDPVVVKPTSYRAPKNPPKMYDTTSFTPTAIPGDTTIDKKALLDYAMIGESPEVKKAFSGPYSHQDIANLLVSKYSYGAGGWEGNMIANHPDAKVIIKALKKLEQEGKIKLPN